MSNITLNKKFSRDDFTSGKEIWLKKGDVFLYEGDAGKANCYLVLSGKMDVRLISGTGHETLLYHLKEGDLVGELAMFGAKVRTATVVANTKTCLYEITASEFKENIKNCEFLGKVTAHFLSRYLKTHDVVSRLGQPNIGMKLCFYFKSLAEQDSLNETETFKTIVLPSHAVLGKLLSCQRESVTRELKKLSQSKILVNKRGNEYDLDMQKVNLYLGDMLEG